MGHWFKPSFVGHWFESVCNTFFFQLEQVGEKDKTTVGMAHMEVSLIDLFVICLGRHG